MYWCCQVRYGTRISDGERFLTAPVPEPTLRSTRGISLFILSDIYICQFVKRNRLFVCVLPVCGGGGV